MFFIGKKHSFLTQAGIPYGFLVFENCAQLAINHLEHGQMVIADALERKIITEEEAKETLSQMAEAQLLENEAAVYDQAVMVELPTDFTPTVSFVAHENCEHPLPHGQLKNNNTSGLSGLLIHTLSEGFEYLADLVLNNKLHPLDGINAFKQMKVVDLPINDKDGQRRYDALPDEKKQKKHRLHIVATDLSGRGIDGTLFGFLLGLGARSEQRPTKEG